MSSRLLVVLCVIGVIVALVVGFAILFGPQALMVYSIKRMMADSPEVAMVPQALLLTPLASPAGRRVAYFGYEFALPWSDVEEEVGGRVVRVTSGSGMTVSMEDPAFPGGPLSDTVFSDPGASAETAALVGSQGYDLYEDLLMATPDQLSWTMLRGESIRVGCLVMLKMVVLVETRGASAIYSFEDRNWRGFQIGQPGQDLRVVLGFFGQGGEEVWLTFEVPYSNRRLLTQDNVNCVITTLQRVPKTNEP